MHLEISQQGKVPGPSAPCPAPRSAARKRFEARIRRLIDMVPQMVVVHDREGRLLAANKAAAQAFGLDGTEILGRNGELLLSKTDPGMLEDERRAMEQGQAVVLPRATFLDAQGRTRVHQTARIPFAVQPGKHSGVLSIALDVQENAAGEEARRDGEGRRLDSMSALAGGVAHEFNNLLVGVLGNAELAQGQLPDQHDLHALLSDVRDAGERMAELSQQLLTLSGRSPLRVASVDLAGLVQESLELGSAAVPPEVAVESDLGERVPRVLGDAAQLREVFLGIVQNAVEACAGRGGTIRVRVCARTVDGRHYVCLEVTDTGCGMDSKTCQHMFDPYFTTKGVGRGLGMALTLGIVRGHHGWIGVKSAHGGGTRISVLLPVETEHPLRRSYEGVHSGQGSAPRAVLLAEEGRELRRQLRHRLERTGLRVLTADTWQETLRVFRLHVAHVRAVLLCESVARPTMAQACRDLHLLKPGIAILTSGRPSRGPEDPGSGIRPDAGKLVAELERLAVGAPED